VAAPTKLNPGWARPTDPEQACYRAYRAQRHHRAPAEQQARAPRPERSCKRCGGSLPRRDRVSAEDGARVAGTR